MKKVSSLLRLNVENTGSTDFVEQLASVVLRTELVAPITPYSPKGMNDRSPFSL